MVLPLQHGSSGGCGTDELLGCPGLFACHALSPGHAGGVLLVWGWAGMGLSALDAGNQLTSGL